MSDTWGEQGWSRIDDALTFIQEGVPDGDHHKAWMIDQIVRILTGCPDEKMTSPAGHTFTTRGMSDQYFQFLQEYTAGDDGPHTYQWDTGTPP